MSEINPLSLIFLPHFPFSWLLEVYGKIYIRAWNHIPDHLLSLFEEQCLQDIMFCAVHAPRSGCNALFHRLRKVGVFVEMVGVSGGMQSGQGRGPATKTLSALDSKPPAVACSRFGVFSWCVCVCYNFSLLLFIL